MSPIREPLRLKAHSNGPSVSKVLGLSCVHSVLMVRLVPPVN